MEVITPSIYNEVEKNTTYKLTRNEVLEACKLYLESLGKEIPSGELNFFWYQPVDTGVIISTCTSGEPMREETPGIFQITEKFEVLETKKIEKEV